MKIEQFKEEHLSKAIKIYDKIIYNRETPDYELDSFVHTTKEQIKENGWAYGKSGFPNWIHARMKIGSQNNEEYFYTLDTNDDNPNMEEIREQNLEYKLKIESEWKKEGIPVKFD